MKMMYRLSFQKARDKDGPRQKKPGHHQQRPGEGRARAEHVAGEEFSRSCDSLAEWRQKSAVWGKIMRRGRDMKEKTATLESGPGQGRIKQRTGDLRLF